MKKLIRLWLLFGMIFLVMPIVFGVNATTTIFDLTNSSNVDNLYDLVKEINILTGKYFMTGILLVSFIILVIALRDQGTSDAMLGAGFITVVLTVLLTSIDFVEFWVAVLIIASYVPFFVFRVIKG